MKSKKYSIIFLSYLIWIIVGFLIEDSWLDIIFSGVTLFFVIFLIYDLIKNNLKYSTPSILNLIIDLLALSTMLSGSIVSINYGNIFVYIFALCTLVFIFTNQREKKTTK